MPILSSDYVLPQPFFSDLFFIGRFPYAAAVGIPYVV